MSTPFAQRVLDSLGEAFRARAGVLLADIVDALTEPAADVDALLRPSATSSSRFYDLDTTTAPGFLGQLVGTTVPAGLSTEAQRAYIRERSRWKRGTPGAMRATLVPLLSGYARVRVMEREGGPHRLVVAIFAAEIRAGVTVERVREAMLSQKPVGIIAELRVSAGSSYGHLSRRHGTYFALAEDFPVYPLMSSHLPGYDEPLGYDQIDASSYPDIASEYPTYDALTGATFDSPEEL